MTYLVHLTMWHKATNKKVKMRFVLPAEDVIMDRHGVQYLIEKQYDLSGMNIFDVTAVPLTTPMFVPPVIDLVDIPSELRPL